MPKLAELARGNLAFAVGVMVLLMIVTVGYLPIVALLLVKPVLDWISNISLILLVCLITAANIDKVVQVFGTRAILAGTSVYRIGSRDWLVARWIWCRYKTGHGARYWAAQHRRRTRGCEFKN